MSASFGARSGLRLPDFAAPPPSAPAVMAPAPPPPDPALLEAARAEGEAEGHARGLAEGVAIGRAEQAAAQEAEVARSLARIAAALDHAAEAGRLAAEQSAEALAALLLGTLDAALPWLAERHGPEMIARLAREMLPGLAIRPEARLLVAPALRDAVAASLPAGAMEVESDPAMAPGDARIVWRDGAVTACLADRRAAIRETLGALGITPVTMEAEKRE